MRVSPTPFAPCLALALVSVLASWGCGDDGPGTETDAGTTEGTDAGGAPVDAGMFDGDLLTIEWGPLTVAPGEEDTQCVVKRLSNATQIRVGQIHNQLGGYSHHLIVYRVASDVPEQPEPQPCTPFRDTLDPSRGAPLTVSQKAEEVITLPPGVGYTLEPGQMIRLELHYINYGREPADVTASTTFVTIPEASFMHEADFLFIGNPDISIAPRSTFTLGPTYLPLPSDLADVSFFSITGHTHQYGTNVTVGVAPAEGAEATPVYNVPGWDWDEPATIYHAPPFQVPAGGGFQFTCEYNNTSDSSVSFGESANEEMCFFWAYYYPSRGARVCAHSDQVGTDGLDVCCPGNPLCSLIF